MAEGKEILSARYLTSCDVVMVLNSNIMLVLTFTFMFQWGGVICCTLPQTDFYPLARKLIRSVKNSLIFFLNMFGLKMQKTFLKDIFTSFSNMAAGKWQLENGHTTGKWWEIICEGLFGFYGT